MAISMGLCTFFHFLLYEFDSLFCTYSIVFSVFALQHAHRRIIDFPIIAQHFLLYFKFNFVGDLGFRNAHTM